MHPRAQRRGFPAKIVNHATVESKTNDAARIFLVKLSKGVPPASIAGDSIEVAIKDPLQAPMIVVQKSVPRAHQEFGWQLLRLAERNRFRPHG
jgi:hypothetical protein